ncbi:hypothetical protein PG995_010516 [Apiospora arundinis]
MSTLTKFALFPQLPYEMKILVWKEAIADEHANRVVPMLESTKRVVLTADVMRSLSKFFGLCKTARDAAFLLYDCPLVVANHGSTRTIQLSTKLDTHHPVEHQAGYLVASWKFSLGVNANSGAFRHSLSAIQPAQLSKIERVMEHQLDLGDLVYTPVPRFDRDSYPSAKVCYIRCDEERPTTQDLVALLGGGPYTSVDVLNHHTNPSLYEERMLAEEETEEDSKEDTDMDLN